MYNKKRSRPVFLSAAVLLILLGSVLVGSTYATINYVDYEKTSKQNEDLDKPYAVSLMYRNGNAYASLLDTKALTENMLWEPGKTKLIPIQLKNTEAFPTSCTLTLNVEDNDFGDMMTYAIYNDDWSNLTPKPGSWDDFKAIARNLAADSEPVKKEAVLNGSHTLLYREQLQANGDEHDEHFITLAIHMNELASSDYASKDKDNPKQLNFYFTLQVDANYRPGEKTSDHDLL